MLLKIESIYDRETLRLNSTHDLNNNWVPMLVLIEEWRMNDFFSHFFSKHDFDIDRAQDLHELILAYYIRRQYLSMSLAGIHRSLHGALIEYLVIIFSDTSVVLFTVQYCLFLVRVWMVNVL